MSVIIITDNCVHGKSATTRGKKRKHIVLAPFPVDDIHHVLAMTRLQCHVCHPAILDIISQVADTVSSGATAQVQ
ncbi:ORF080L [Infectious spleen and kidney necrosis virus]|uniref:ORF080L n=1 Tax=Infectious spleen and kidney necrosis virus TaxID=180170 RepID=A0A140G0Q0_ISKNV|nr:ORF080L [Infectious spleen and kidney necrosis virus]